MPRSLLSMVETKHAVRETEVDESSSLSLLRNIFQLLDHCPYLVQSTRSNTALVRLQKERILNMVEFYGSGARFVVVAHGIDSSAQGIASA
jgi:hypothetical protein